MNGQVGADRTEQNTAKAVHWRNWQALVDRLWSLHNVIRCLRIVTLTGALVLSVTMDVFEITECM